jgi:hypothetical protein
MNSNVSPLVREPSPGVAAPLNVVLAYDNHECGARARRMLERLLFKTAADLDVHYDEWPIDELEHPQCRQEARELALHSDIFVVAASAIAEPFVEFVADWLAAKSADAALILIEHPCGGAVTTEFAHLRCVAAEAGVTCLSTILPNSSGDAGARASFLLASNSAPEISPIND